MGHCYTEELGSSGVLIQATEGGGCLLMCRYQSAMEGNMALLSCCWCFTVVIHILLSLTS